MAFGWCLKYNCAARVHHATTLIATISWPRIQHHSATIHGYPSSRIVMDLPIVRRSPLEILYPRSIGRSCSDLPIDRYIDSMIDGNRITIELDRHGILATVRRFLNVQVRYNYALGRRRRTCFISRWREPESDANSVHARTKTPVRTIRKRQRRQSFYI